MMIRYAEALQALEQLADERREEIGREEIALGSSLGRISARVHSGREALPAFDHASMDGFAVVAADTLTASASQPLRLSIVGESAAGRIVSTLAGGRSCPGLAYRIMTGAMLPKPCDGVVRVEDTTEEGSEVILREPVAQGQFVRMRGEDFAIGDTALAPHRMVTTEDLMLAAALGMTHLEVFRLLRVVIIATGEEIADWRTQKLEEGIIRNATTPLLQAKFLQNACQVLYHTCVGDKAEAIAAAIDQALSHKPDLIITTGGVSAGRYDYVPEVVTRLGGQVYFHKVAIRPGKPILCAGWSKLPAKTLLFGLPGNPVSTAVGFSFFVLPYLRALLGQGPLRYLRAQLGEGVSTVKTLHTFLKARVRPGSQGELIATALTGQGSHRMASLREAEAWLVIDDETENLNATAVVPLIFNSHLNLA